MSEKYNRRFFLKTSLAGAGAIAFNNNVFPSIPMSAEKRASYNKGKKKFHATTDFIDNVYINERGSRYGEPIVRTAEYYKNNKSFMDRAQLDDLHQFFVSVGVTRHQWIMHNTSTLYENYPHGFDLLAEAVKSAHAKGLEFYAEIKPFEGGSTGIGGTGLMLPHSMPCPEGVAYKDLRGIFPSVSPFVVKNLQMNLKRRPGTYDYNPIASIRFVKSDDKPTRVKAEHLSISSSPTNNEFVPYKGPISFRETVEKRYRFPYWRKCRILHLENLNIPAGHRYFLIKCSLADNNGDFENEKGNIIELVDAKGNIMPSTLSTGQVNLESHLSFYNSKLNTQLIPYLQSPEVQAEINNPQKMKEHYSSFYSFGEYRTIKSIILDKEGYVAAACGKPEYMFGNLHPIYPEVQEYWLTFVNYCLERGVDGINIRVANHTRSPESWEYGFNAPVLNATNGETSYMEISRVNGNAYTQFLRKAHQMIKKRGKAITIHLYPDMLPLNDRTDKLNSLPPNFEWQWETWVKELADDLEFRGVFRLRPYHLQQALDEFSAVTKMAGKPFYFQSDFHGLEYDGPYYSTEEEIEMVKKDKRLDGYVLFETANFTKINEKGRVEGSPEMVKLLKRCSLKEL